jgi:AcrR family transcriptional regulator
MWLSARYERAQTPGISPALELWFGAIHAAAQPVVLPEVCATHMDVEPLLAPEDEQLNKLLNAMLVNVGKYGFEGTTTAKISKHSGLSEGYLFNRYKSKMDLFVAATARQHDAGFKLNQDFFTAIETKYGIGIAEAVGIREAQLPHRDLARTMLLEQLRVGWHYLPLLKRAEAAHNTFRAQLLKIPGYAKRESEAEFFINVALSIGVAAMPIIDPNSAKYPYVAITAPLYAQIEAR